MISLGCFCGKLVYYVRWKFNQDWQMNTLQVSDPHMSALFEAREAHLIYIWRHTVVPFSLLCQFSFLWQRLWSWTTYFHVYRCRCLQNDTHFTFVQFAGNAPNTPPPEAPPPTRHSPHEKENSKAPHYWCFVRGIHQWPLDTSYKGPIRCKMFPHHESIMYGYMSLGRSYHWILIT